MTEHVKTEIAAGIMTLTLARPDKMNALSNAVYSAMSDGLERAEKDASVRVVLFQGDGDKVVKDALDSKGGFTWVLAGLKALKERNLELNAIADAFPKGLKGKVSGS